LVAPAVRLALSSRGAGRLSDGLGAFAVNFFIALIALLDPIGNVPVFAAATSNASGKGDGRWRPICPCFCSLSWPSSTSRDWACWSSSASACRPSASRAASSCCCSVLRWCARTSPRPSPTPPAKRIRPDYKGYARRGFERLVVPFGMPLLIGPGAISAVIIFAGEAKRFGAAGTATGIGVLAVAALTILLCLFLTGPIGRLLGKIGVALVVRVLGLILCALAIQFIIIGLGEATIGFINAEAANPYAH
jgi:multiple antibiotic resistance protein